MKRQSGCKISLPLVLDTLQQFGLPIYICVDKPVMELIVKPSDSDGNVLQDDVFLPALQKIIAKKGIQWNTRWSIYNLLKEDINTYKNAALLFALYEEGHIDIEYGTLLDWVEEYMIHEVDNKGLFRTLITGGICLSNELVHQRIFSAEGLYIMSVSEMDKNDASSLNIEQKFALILACMRDDRDLFRKVLPQRIGAASYELGYMYDLRRSIHLVFTEVLDTSLIKENEWICAVSQEGAKLV